MNVTLWIVQGMLAAGFIYAGWLKAFQYETAKSSWLWVKDVPRTFVFMIGMLELIGMLGLIVPMATGIAPVLTPLAALGLGVIVLFGAVYHIMRKEYKEIGINIVFLVLAAVVFIGRW